MRQKLIPIVVLSLSMQACSIKDPTYDVNSYNCSDDFAVDSSLHPHNDALLQAMSEIQSQGVTGFSALIHTADGFWVGALGKADIAANASFKTCTKSMLGSTTKTLVGALAAKLQQEGLINLSDKASNYLDAALVKEVANLDQVTIEQLLNHTSGIPEYLLAISGGLDLIGNMDNPDHSPSTMERLEYIYGVDAYFKPGNGHHYSNTNYLLVDLVLENATGKPLSQLFDEYMFIPLGLNSTVYDASTSYTPGQAQGYLDFFDNGKFRNNTLADGGARTAHGGAISNVFDLYTFFNAILDSNAGYLTQASIDAIQNWTQHPYNNTSKTRHYGLGLVKTTTDTGSYYSHDGLLLNGYNANIIYYVEQQTTVIYLANSATGSYKVKGLMGDFTKKVEAILF